MTTSIDEKKKPLLAALQKAVEVELATLPPYLVALWSIRPGTNIEPAQILRSVLMEEMLHMTLAANVLSAVGGTVRLDADRLPAYPLKLDFDAPDAHRRIVDIPLAAFSPEALHTFMQIELPRDMAPRPRALAATRITLQSETIGAFYDGIQQMLRGLDEELGTAALFSGDATHQVSPQYYWKGGGRPVVVKRLADALQAIGQIVAQGEGVDGSVFERDRHFAGSPEEVAHYFRLNQILQKRRYAPGDHTDRPPSGAEIAVDFTAVFPVRPDAHHADYRDDPRMTALNERFNGLYSSMLAQLAEGFGGNPAVFYTATMNSMRGMTEVARAMMQTPIAGDAARRTGLPTFEWHPPAPG